MAGLADARGVRAQFAYLQIDLTDPEFRAHLAKSARATREELQKLIREAVEPGELTATTNPATRADDGSGGQRLDDELGVLPGRPRREMDADDLDAVLKPY